MNIKASLEMPEPTSHPRNDINKGMVENRNKRTLKSIAKSINENSFSQKDVFDDDFIKFENANCKLTPAVIITILSLFLIWVCIVSNIHPKRESKGDSQLMDNTSIKFSRHESTDNFKDYEGTSKSAKKSLNRRRKLRQDSANGHSKKVLRAINKKYIEEAKRKSTFPETFIYANFIRKIKRNFKEFFINPQDLVQNSNGQINRKKGGKRTLSQGIYEFGEGFFDLKFDGKIGVRSSFNPKNKKIRTSISAVNKANHFWWLVSKAYLNKFLLQDAKDILKSFIDDPVTFEFKEENKDDEEEEETIENIQINIEPLFNSK
jgi:hypothetical protein